MIKTYKNFFKNRNQGKLEMMKTYKNFFKNRNKGNLHYNLGISIFSLGNRTAYIRRKFPNLDFGCYTTTFKSILLSLLESLVVC